MGNSNKYFIDGNNLIGKIKDLKHLQKKEGQLARERLVFLLDRFLASKKFETTVYFDGFQKDAIKSHNLRIIYSDYKLADELIKRDISNATNRKKITVVSSDGSVTEFARVCSCNTVSSEMFAKKMLSEKENFSEKQAELSRNELDEFKKLFGVKE